MTMGNEREECLGYEFSRDKGLLAHYAALATSAMD